MVFSSTVFLFVFLPLLLIVYFNPILKWRAFRNGVLLLASLLFYAWGEPVFVLLLLVSIALTWAIGLGVAPKGKQERGNKKLLIVGTAYHVVLMFIFKYLTFFLKQLGMVLQSESEVIEITLPIGISFFTFQLMSYLFDVYYGKAKVQKNPFYVALYVVLFPQMIAGPIVRYEQVAEEIITRTESLEQVLKGTRRFAYGLAKKVLLSNYLAVIADNVFDFTTERTVLTAWLGAIAYALQIYFDFSGYSDMAIGLGQMFGFHFAENFNYPYIAKTVTDFWRRWHISLSSWFRDYVYIPLGGNRVKKSRWIWNLFVVWALTGIWHGANWTFLAWGMFYFVILLVEKLTGFAEKIGRLSYVYTLVVVCVAWVMFRSPSMGAAVAYIGTMFGIGATGFVDGFFVENIKGGWMILAVALPCATPIYHRINKWLLSKHLEVIESIFCIIVFAAAVLQTICATYNPFIYFNF